MAYVFRQGDLPIYKSTAGQTSRQWDAYLGLSGLVSQAAAKQVQALTLCFSQETVTIVDNLGLSADQRGDAKEIVLAIQWYVEGQVNESVERRNFRQRQQQPGESFDDFLVALRELAKTCKFCSEECTKKNIRDQVIEGLLDGNTTEELLRVSDLTLEEAIAKYCALEAAKKQRAKMGHIDSTPDPVIQATHGGRAHSTPPSSSSSAPGGSTHRFPCLLQTSCT